MATPFDNAGGLLGISPELLAQFTLPEEERKRLLFANMMLGLGAGLLSSKRGSEFGHAGLGIMSGLNAGQQQVMDAAKLRGMGITQALGAEKLRRDVALTDAQLNELGIAQHGQTAPAPTGGMQTQPLPGYSPASGASAPPQDQNVTRTTLMTKARELGIEEAVRYALVSGGPEGFRAAAKLVADASKPNTVSQGQLVYGPTGKLLYSAPNLDKGMEMGPAGAQPIPGYVDAAQQIASAAERAKAQQDLVQIQQGRQTVSVPRDVAIANTRAMWAGTPGGPTPQQQAWITSQGGPDFRGAGVAGGGAPGTFGVSADPLDTKAAEQRIATQGAQDTEVAKSQGSEFISILQAEKQAPNNIGKLNLLKSHLSQVDTGKAAPAVQTLKAYASYFAPDLAKSWTQDTPYAQASSALSNEMALQLRNPSGGAGMPGALSDSDRNFLVSMTASVANDPRAIPLMIDARIALEKRSQDIGRIARDYRARNGRIDDGMYAEISAFAEHNPLFANQQKQIMTQAPVVPDRAAVEAELRRRRVIQ